MSAKILIVDDDVHIRLLIQYTLEVLEDQDVELFTAADGEEALNLIRSERPSLVILDAMMPRLDGFEVCEQVKKDPQIKDTYIVILTAKGQEFDIRKGQSVGADRYITKPFDPDALLSEAERVLGLA